MKLKAYLNSLSLAERRDLAKRAGTTENYLAQLKGQHRTPSTRLCHRLVRASAGRLTLAELRPDIWPRQAA
jgi:DNA-binding transcriptional regulator YdaS (Cro superfamily)